MIKYTLVTRASNFGFKLYYFQCDTSLKYEMIGLNKDNKGEMARHCSFGDQNAK